MNPDARDEPTERQLAAIDALLARTDVWDDPPSGLGDAVVAAIVAEAAATGGAPVPAEPVADARVSLDEQRALRTSRRRTFPTWLAAAAVAAVVVGGVAIATRGGDPARGGTEIALAATDAAPGATAAATLSATPAGLKILLDVDGLPGAPDDAFYEAWISDGTTRVSAGTFHLREGDNEIELWAGVADPHFDRIAITLEPLDGVADSSGNVLLAGTFELDG